MRESDEPGDEVGLRRKARAQLHKALGGLGQGAGEGLPVGRFLARPLALEGVPLRGGLRKAEEGFEFLEVRAVVLDIGLPDEGYASPDGAYPGVFTAHEIDVRACEEAVEVALAQVRQPCDAEVCMARGGARRGRSGKAEEGREFARGDAGSGEEVDRLAVVMRRVLPLSHKGGERSVGVAKKACTQSARHDWDVHARKPGAGVKLRAGV